MPLSKINTNSLSTTSNIASNLIASEGTTFTLRNKVINGDFKIDQRYNGANNSSITITTYGQYPVDKFQSWQFTGSTFSSMQQKSGDGPTGFSHYLRTLTTSTYNSFGSAVGYSLRTVIEGTSISDLGWGTSGSSPATLSFWVRASVPGIYCTSVRSCPVSYGYTAEYTINQANTWEYKTVVIPGPTANGTTAFPVDNTASIDIVFVMGSNHTAVANTWKNNSLWSTPNQVNMFATNGSTFDITGVQFEKGSIATPFENRPAALEMTLCQRYTRKYFYSDMTKIEPAYPGGTAGNYFIAYMPIPTDMSPGMSLANIGSRIAVSVHPDPYVNTATYTQKIGVVVYPNGSSQGILYGDVQNPSVITYWGRPYIRWDINSLRATRGGTVVNFPSSVTPMRAFFENYWNSGYTAKSDYGEIYCILYDGSF